MFQIGFQTLRDSSLSFKVRVSDVSHEQEQPGTPRNTPGTPRNIKVFSTQIIKNAK